MNRKPTLSNSKKKQIKSLIDQASRALGNGRSNICEQLCAKIDTLQPGNPHVANMRGIIRSNAGQLNQAVALFEQATTAAPQTGEFHANLANLYLKREQYTNALSSYQRAIQCGTKIMPVLMNYTKALIELRRYTEAEEILQGIRKQHPSNAEVLMRLSHICYESDRPDEATEYLQQVIRENPDHDDAYLWAGQLAIEEGRMDEGRTEIRKCLKLNPENAEALAELASIKKYDSEDDEDIAAVVFQYERSMPNSEGRAWLGFAAGKMMDDLGDYDRAFGYFKEANDIRDRKSSYHRESELAHIESIIERYTSDVLARSSGLDDTSPIFIVGMPRCGSTLTEQILASHPGVVSRGECDILERKVLPSFHTEEAPLTLERITSFSPEQWREIGMDYLDHAQSGIAEGSYITDKSLNNIRLVGAIHCALPNARIVHVRRHPLDTCLSIYKLNLQGRMFDFGRNLEELGHYYQMYLRLMQHWREVLPEGFMYELDYETLVTNQEEETRKLLDACGLDWDAQCLEFHQARNTVRTASVTQVRRSMYKDSLAGWKRYEKHLEPLIRILGTEQAA